MNLSDKLADLAIERQLDLNRYTGSLQNNILRLMRDLAADIEEQFRGDLTEYNKARLSALIREIRALVADTYGVLADQLSTDFPQLAADEAAWARQSFNAAVGANLMASLPTETAIAGVAREVIFQDMPLSDWLKRQEGDTNFRINQAIRTGISLGETNGKIMKRLGDLKVKNIGDQTALGITRRNLNTIVRTAVQDVTSSAQMKTLEANSDIIKALQHLSTLDSKTSDICIARSGLTWSVLDKKPIGHDIVFIRPPVHPNCRSKIIPVVKSFRELGLDIEDYKPSVRASMDGEVAADTTFAQFLDRKGKAFQDDVLGPGRADLWRSGKITLPELLDPQSGRVLTLRELQARYGQ